MVRIHVLNSGLYFILAIIQLKHLPDNAWSNYREYAEAMRKDLCVANSELNFQPGRMKLLRGQKN